MESCKFGQPGSVNGRLKCTCSVAMDAASGNIIAADRHNLQTKVFCSIGSFLHQFGEHGSGDGQLNYPSDLAVDAASGTSSRPTPATIGNRRFAALSCRRSMLFLAHCMLFGRAGGMPIPGPVKNVLNVN